MTLISGMLLLVSCPSYCTMSFQDKLAGKELEEWKSLFMEQGLRRLCFVSVSIVCLYCHFYSFLFRCCLGAIMGRFKDQSLKNAEESMKRWLNTSGQRKWEINVIFHTFCFQFNVTAHISTFYFECIPFDSLKFYMFFTYKKLLHYIFSVFAMFAPTNWSFTVQYW